MQNSSYWISTLIMLDCFASLSYGTTWKSPTFDEQSAARHIHADSIAAHVQFLADDLLEGRGPGTRGDALAQKYIAAQFKNCGFKPIANNGTWFQTVPLVSVTTELPKILTLRGVEDSLSLKVHDEFVANTGRPESRISIHESQLVFVGYGIQAPEYDWNDFKNADLRGKTLLIMNNDPSNDPKLFAGNRRLYYGRWDYKYDMAAKVGAAGAIIIHTTPSAGYPFQVVQTSWTGPQSELAGRTGPRLDLSAWVTENAARKITRLGRFDLDDLRAAAQTREFQPVDLKSNLSIELNCEIQKQQTANVLGLLVGSDPKLRKEVVIYMAHHDHMGIAVQRDERGDNIYNGAVDNATGVAGLLAVARAYSQLKQRPSRSILFATVGAEEQGLLGSKYFAANPPVHPGKMAAVINIDGLNVLGKTHDVNFIGYGKSSLDPIVEGVAKWQKRTVFPDRFPDRGYYYRSDQFSLAKIGVPGVYLHSGTQVIGKPPRWGKQQLEDWIENKYHQPSDEYSADWNLSGAVEDLQLLFYVGLQLANQQELPQWNSGDEFEAARKAAQAK